MICIDLKRGRIKTLQERRKLTGEDKTKKRLKAVDDELKQLQIQQNFLKSIIYQMKYTQDLKKYIIIMNIHLIYFLIIQLYMKENTYIKI